MKTSTKIKTFIIIFFVAIVVIITARHFIGLHFKKKFSTRPPPGVIVTKVEKSLFYKSIETFGTAIAQNSKTYRVKKDNIVGNLNIENRFVKKDEIIIALKDGENIIADFEGKLGKREIAQGVLGTESFILTLDDTSSIVLNIKVPEIYLNILKPGLSAEVKSDSFKRRFYGTVNSVSSRVDPSTRSVLANIVVENKELKLIPGMLLDIKIIYDKKEQLGIPENSILIQGDTAFVYKVLEDNTVNKVEIKIGKRNFGKVSIAEGLSLGDKIVTEGISKVRDKIKIKILD